MYINFDENRPDTPRVPPTLTRLERVLLAVVAYQFLLVSYLLAPTSFWAKPVHDLISPDEQLRYVQIEPMIDRKAVPKKPAPLSDLDRRSATPQPIPKPQNEEPFSKGNTPEPLTAAQPEPPKAAPAPPVTGPSPNEARLTPPRVPGGILGSALRDVQRYAQSQNYDNPEGAGGEQGSDIQFDSKGVDFGAWLRRFKAQVTRNWLIPQAAMVMHGHVAIQMSILRNGTIVNPHIILPSGIEAFDTAALSALKLSNPTMKLPDAYPGEALDPFTVTFYYNERIR
jgi:outer membrane biosynthesis protein TonB